MYIEDKSDGLAGACRIGRVTFSKTGATLHYGARSFQSLKGRGFKANYFEVDSGRHFWISGPRKDGADGLYGRITQPDDVDPDVAEEYWRDVRGMEHVPGSATQHSAASVEMRRQLLESVRASGSAKASPGPSAARSQDFLYE
jgi:hypothetical protein